MATKKNVAKKSAARITKKSVTPKSVPPALKAITAPQTKLQILQAIADEAGLARKDVGDVFKALGTLVQRHMKRRGSGEFAIPDTGVKIRRVRKPATKSRKGRNPATGEEITIAAKPARTVVKVTALKALKDSVTL